MPVRASSPVRMDLTDADDSGRDVRRRSSARPAASTFSSTTPGSSSSSRSKRRASTTGTLCRPSICAGRFCARAPWPRGMKRRRSGAIINVSSNAGRKRRQRRERLLRLEIRHRGIFARAGHRVRALQRVRQHHHAGPSGPHGHERGHLRRARSARSGRTPASSRRPSFISRCRMPAD